MSRIFFLFSAAFLVFSSHPAFAGTASGNLVHPKATVAIKFAYLVKGPDSFDSTKTIRRLIFSSSDLSAKLQACTTMSCSDGALTEGMTVDLDSGSRMNYWMALKGGTIQFSGTEEMTSLKTSADDAKHLAGKLSFDDTGMGGPKVDVEFDANFVKAFTKAR